MFQSIVVLIYGDVVVREMTALALMAGTKHKLVRWPRCVHCEQHAPAVFCASCCCWCW